MSKHSPQHANDFSCPHCGATVSGRASFCRECGASDESGWNDDVSTDVDTDDEFDYDDFVSREFPDQAGPWTPQQSRRLFVGIVIAVIIFTMLAWTLIG